MRDGKRVQEVLIERGISQSELAERLGTSKQHTSQLLRSSKFHIKTRHKLCKVLKLKPSFFIAVD